MPQLNAAKKALRVSARRRTINDRWRKQLRELTRELKGFITAADKAKASELFQKLKTALDSSARRNIIHRNKASRLKSRLSHAIAKLK